MEKTARHPCGHPGRAWGNCWQAELSQHLHGSSQMCHGIIPPLLHCGAGEDAQQRCARFWTVLLEQEFYCKKCHAIGEGPGRAVAKGHSADF